MVAAPHRRTVHVCHPVGSGEVPLAVEHRLSGAHPALLNPVGNLWSPRRNSPSPRHLICTSGLLDREDYRRAITAKHGYGRVMDQSVQRMTLQELRDELERTRPAWDAEVADLDGVLAGGELSALSEDAHRHQMVANELLRRPSEG